MARKRVEEPRCVNGENCVAYPTLGEPSKLSRGNPGPRCFACEERRVASKLKATAAEKEEVAERGKANEPSSGKSDGPGAPTRSSSAAGGRYLPANGGCVRRSPLATSASCGSGRGHLGKPRPGWLGPKRISSGRGQQRGVCGHGVLLRDEVISPERGLFFCSDREHRSSRLTIRPGNKSPIPGVGMWVY